MQYNSKTQAHFTVRESHYKLLKNYFVLSVPASISTEHHLDFFLVILAHIITV